MNCYHQQIPQRICDLFPVDLGVDLGALWPEITQCKRRFHQDLWNTIFNRVLEDKPGWKSRTENTQEGAETKEEEAPASGEAEEAAPAEGEEAPASGEEAAPASGEEEKPEEAGQNENNTANWSSSARHFGDAFVRGRSRLSHRRYQHPQQVPDSYSRYQFPPSSIRGVSANSVCSSAKFAPLAVNRRLSQAKTARHHQTRQRIPQQQQQQQRQQQQQQPQQRQKFRWPVQQPHFFIQQTDEQPHVFGSELSSEEPPQQFVLHRSSRADRHHSKNQSGFFRHRHFLLPQLQPQPQQQPPPPPPPLPPLRKLPHQLKRPSSLPLNVRPQPRSYSATSRREILGCCHEDVEGEAEAEAEFSRPAGLSGSRQPAFVTAHRPVYTGLGYATESFCNHGNGQSPGDGSDADTAGSYMMGTTGHYVSSAFGKGETRPPPWEFVPLIAGDWWGARPHRK